jgi:hypothetical protein
VLFSAISSKSESNASLNAWSMKRSFAHQVICAQMLIRTVDKFPQQRCYLLK